MKYYECCGNKINSFKRLRAHMEMAHGLKTEGLQVTKRMMSHMDGADWWSSVYEITAGDVVFHEYIREKRTGEDALLWGAE